jgi:hypothetical protein
MRNLQIPSVKKPLLRQVTGAANHVSERIILWGEASVLMQQCAEELELPGISRLFKEAPQPVTVEDQDPVHELEK